MTREEIKDKLLVIDSLLLGEAIAPMGWLGLHDERERLQTFLDEMEKAS